MRKLLVVGFMALAGCSSAPPNAGVQSSAADQPAAAQSTAGEAKLAAANKSNFTPPPGYRAKIDDWSIVYCKKTQVLGSRFPKEVCMTEEQLKDHMASTDAMRRDVDQTTRVCSNPAVCGGT